MKIRTNAGMRLLATSKVNPKQIQMATVLYHMKQHKLKADFTDDDKDMVVCRCNMSQVLMALSGLGWGHDDEEEIVGGMYCSGVSVKVQAQQPLKLMQTSVDRVIICLDTTPLTTQSDEQ
jgi:hypothetical protein